LCGSVNNVVYKTNANNLEELRDDNCKSLQPFQARKPDSKHIPQLYIHSFSQRGNIFSFCSSTGELFIKPSTGYYHSKCFSCCLHQLLNLPRLGIQHNISH